MKIAKLLAQLRSSTIPIALVWALVIGIYTAWQYYRIQLNTTASMPQTLWFVKIGEMQLRTGDYLTARIHDSRAPDGVYENVVKQVGGVAGDKVLITSTPVTYLVNGAYYQVHERLSGYPVTPLTDHDVIIPNGCYFVHGQNNPTFDSRYKEFGLICESQIYGKAYPIF